MPSPIVILHGWSDDSKSFKPLADFLRGELDAEVTTLDLADWVSLDDEITFSDLRHAMERAWKAHPVLKNTRETRLITHSTGALVVRDWMTHFYTSANVPISRHIMLAPANFGSQLAHKGRAWYGRVFKGWRTGFQTGGHLLKGLELASSYTDELADRDLFGSNYWYGPKGVLACVFVGNCGYGGVKAVTDEVGGDGTVRVSTANLRAARLSLRFFEDERPEFEIESAKGITSLGFAIADGDNHSTITFRKRQDGVHGPVDKEFPKRLLRALTVPANQWSVFVSELGETAVTPSERVNDDDYFHAYQNTPTRVRDSLGNSVEDYLLEFRRARHRRFRVDEFSGHMQRDVIRDVHAFSGDSSLRSFYFDVTRLRKAAGDDGFTIELESLPRFKDKRSAVGYGDPVILNLTPDDVSAVFQPDRTLFVDIEVPRKIGDKAFRLKRHSE